ncbi:MAG: hypothetical protein ACXVWU_11875 [Nocardioides sp.]
MYTLLGAPLLGFDLCRRPGGAGVAALLESALAVTPDVLSRLSDAFDAGTVGWQARASVATPEAGRLAEAMGRTAQLVAEGRVGEALRLLETASMAGLPEILALLRDEVFDWTWTTVDGRRTQSESAVRGVAVLGDAVVAAYHAGRLSPALTDQLRSPYRRALARPPRLRLGPYHAALADALDRVAAASAEQVAALGASADRSRERAAWAPAMHSATWAVHLSGRTREAAGAQLRAVRALADAGVTAGEAAAGTWNLVSAACQALVVSDLLDSVTWSRLVAPLVEVVGRFDEHL